MNYPAQIVINVLYREFPDFAVKVNDRIREKLPEQKFDDFSIIEYIVDSFCESMSTSRVDLYNARMVKSNTHKRRILIAVLLKLYQPEMLFGLITGFLDPRITKILMALLGVSRVTVSFDVKRSLKFYQLYSDFRESVDDLHNNFIEQYGTKENSKTSS